MSFEVYHSKTFDEKLGDMSKDFRLWLEKIEDQLVNNPYVGDPLGVRWFREKKKNGFRIYYLIYDNVKAVYLVNISSKKDQQAIINAIWLLIDNFKEEIINLVKRK